MPLFLKTSNRALIVGRTTPIRSRSSIYSTLSQLITENPSILEMAYQCEFFVKSFRLSWHSDYLEEDGIHQSPILLAISTIMVFCPSHLSLVGIQISWRKDGNNQKLILFGSNLLMLAAGVRESRLFALTIQRNVVRA